MKNNLEMLLLLVMNIKEESKKEYTARINRVMDYVEHNITGNLNLGTLAEVGSFSAYHFHRIFALLTGETINNFVQRVRVEKAAQLLWNSNESISNSAYCCGFGSVSVFSRTFRKYFGITAKQFREFDKPVFAVNGLRYSKNGKLLSKNNKLNDRETIDLCNTNLKNLLFMDTKIEIKEMPEMNVVYCRHIGNFSEIGNAYNKLMQWAAPRGLLQFPKTKTVTVYHDDPSITDIEKVRQSACITVEGDVKVDGEIGKMVIEGGKYAVGRFEIAVTEFEKAWNTMCAWFTESGYQPGEGNTYELYYNDHIQHPERKFIFDICIPVKQL